MGMGIDVSRRPGGCSGWSSDDALNVPLSGGRVSYNMFAVLGKAVRVESVISRSHL